MKNVNRIQCEGCGQIFRPEDLTKDGIIGRHEWGPLDRPNLWTSVGFISYSEQECQENMRRWNAAQQDYETREAQANQRNEENVQRVVERCRQDDLLRQIVSTGDMTRAKSRIDSLCNELGFWNDTDLAPMGFEWDYWSRGFYQQCFDAAQGKI